ncbi:DUF445 family protein [Alteromonas sp. 345S023]|uniref:DUF445 family protein n=1 Tax=Alteromonas profundi TaxID=2696062 RepID=A0A7X5LKH2_9ALTE|nr:DUF445 family protein [Alteromonas profundi]NDV90988.1 DUF445 family protein [Alteromonas profundi]
MLDKSAQLNQAKRMALACLIFAAVVFVAATCTQVYFPQLAQSKWLGLVKMASEAALIGGLADWFAVTALFKPIPRKYPIPHTNIVANNKHAIADNLALFVKEKFFHVTAIEQLIASSHPAKGAGRWLSNEQHAARLSRFLCDALAGMLTVLDDAPVKRFIAKTAQRGIEEVDLRQLIATVLASVTRDRQHQVILDKLLGKLAQLLAEPDTQEYIAETLVVWLKTEHSRIEKLLPSSWLSEQGALIAVRAVSHMLDDVYADAQHPLRYAFDEQVDSFIEAVNSSDDMEQKISQFKQKLIHDPALKRYLSHTWNSLQRTMLTSLKNKEGKVETKVAGWLKGLGDTLLHDDSLASTFDAHIGEAGKYMAPELAEFLTRHIRDTINSWDESEMASQIELNIGRDLQKVRINGTIVGGLIGAILFVIEQAIFASAG